MDSGVLTGALAESYDSLLCDLDGVVYTGHCAVPGAVAALSRAVDAGLSLGYVTNNASRSPEQVAAHLRELGAPAAPRQVFGSAQVGAELLSDQLPVGAGVLVVGSEALAAEVSTRGFRTLTSAEAHLEPVQAVIQGFDPDVGWADLAEASFAVRSGALWIATNTDLTIPVARGIAPGNGSFVAAVAQATGAVPLVAGKPQPMLFRLAADRLGARRPLVLGDRLDTDIRGGRSAGLASALVLTGIDDAWTALAADPAERPEYLLGDLGELFASYSHPAPDGSGTRCGVARAEVRQDVLSIEAPEGCLDGWRAGCAAWWAAHPRQAARPNVQWRS